MSSKISVIISNYNYGNYISEAMESVLAQTYQNFELIVVDDGSTDHSKTIIEQYQKKYPDQITTIIKENGGQASAFNAGFHISTGDIIAFLDADDYWYPDKLEVVVEAHKHYPAVQHNLKVNNKELFTNLEDGVEKQQHAWEHYGFAGYIPTSGLSFRKAEVSFVFPLQDGGIKACADWYLKAMFLNRYDIYSINAPLGFYRAHEDNNWFNNKSKYDKFGEFVTDCANEYRKLHHMQPVPQILSIDIREYLCSTVALEDNTSYIIFGTGQLGRYLHDKIKKSHRVAGFTNSMDEHQSELQGLTVYPLTYLQNNSQLYDKIIIASDAVGEIVYLLTQRGFSADVMVCPQF